MQSNLPVSQGNKIKIAILSETPGAIFRKRVEGVFINDVMRKKLIF